MTSGASASSAAAAGWSWNARRGRHEGRKPGEIVAGTVEKVPHAPKWLSAEAKAEWRRILPDLVERRILSVADLGTVENYCILVGRVREIERLVQASFDVKLVIAQRNAAESARRIAAEIGATPVSRSRPTVRSEGEGDDLSFLG